MNRDPKMWARLGQAIAHTRRAEGLSQTELAERAGVSHSSVQSAENGKAPKARMPQTIPPIVRALGWPDDAVETVLQGGEPPAGWKDLPVQQQIDADAIEAGMTNAMVRASENVTAAQIKAAVGAAMDELRQQGLI